ncbi:hypothetical protein ACSHWB_40790 [Lentzea sp. HUAS TT2]|uniref:hypothetical protein n=1 Tax=Lentzea sp. HUAS TT2 TaxID=3447454 RepID=UPI003F7135D2
MDWEEAVRALRTALPSDYRRLVERYGGGQAGVARWSEARGEEWEHFEMGCAEFLAGTLTGEVRSDLLWSRHPTDPTRSCRAG